MLSITEAAARLRDGSCSSEELTLECLSRIERLNPTSRPTADVDRLRAALGAFRREVGKAFSEFNVIVSPTLPTLPIRISDAQASFALGYCTFEANVGGLPSISVPCGYSSDGLPIGLQITGAPLADSRVLAVAGAYEAAAQVTNQLLHRA